MKNTIDLSISKTTGTLLEQVELNIAQYGRDAQRKQIAEHSPYSEKINAFINGYNELRIYSTLGLCETEVTRPALVRYIDFDMWVSCRGRTNRELMKEGLSPFAYDSEDGMIELHHIGQAFEAPFAELTMIEHKMHGNSKLLHDVSTVSWRNDKTKDAAFNTEKINYWRKRCDTYLPLEMFQPLTLPDTVDETDEKLSESIIKTIEVLLKECNVRDLGYIKSLSESYITSKKIGAVSIQEYVAKSQPIEELKCTFCGSKKYVSYGYYKTEHEKIPRFMCKKCFKTFTRTNHSIISDSKLTFMDWMKFIDCLKNGYSTSKTAEVCGISKTSVQTNKNKLFMALAILDSRVKLNGNIVVDETYISESLKGTKEENMPRKARKRGGECHTKGLSKEKICIECAVNDDGVAVAYVIGKGMPSKARIENVLDNNIVFEEDTCVFSDKGSALMAYFSEKNCTHRSVRAIYKSKLPAAYSRMNKEDRETYRYLQKTNSFHARLKKFLQKFLGVSTNHLQGYVSLFTWLERNKTKESEEAYKELLSVMTQKNLYSSDVSSGDVSNDTCDKKHKFNNPEKAIRIWDKRNKGISVIAIAKEEGISRQCVYQYLDACRENGMEYTVFSIDAAPVKETTSITVKKKSKRKANNERLVKRNQEIYNLRKEWNGDLEDFYNVMGEKYCLSPHTIKQIVFVSKKMEEFKGEIFCCDNYDYKNIKDTYTEIFDRYCSLDTKISQARRIQAIAKEYDYTPANILRIVNKMSCADAEAQFEKSRKKTAKTELVNRNKAMFVEFLSWEGSRKDFFVNAAKKYNLSEIQTRSIINQILDAVPERREMIS